MLEFIVVPHPAFGPNACVSCGSAAGPVSDTHRELPSYGRVYICKLCTSRSAIAHGLVKGKRMNELEEAARIVDIARADLAARDKTVADLEATLDEANRRIAVLAAENETLDGRVEQLRAAIAKQAQDNLSLVG